MGELIQDRTALFGRRLFWRRAALPAQYLPLEYVYARRLHELIEPHATADHRCLAAEILFRENMAGGEQIVFFAPVEYLFTKV